MAKSHSPIFSWDEENGVASCIITDGYNTFIGNAFCYEDDLDMKSEKTGCTIALWRAEIAYYKHIRDNVLKPALAALKQLYYSMNTSKYFDENSYAVNMLKRQIENKNMDLDEVNEMISQKKEMLSGYINEKEKTYQKIRKIKKEREGDLGQK